MNERNFFNDPSIAVTRNLLIINILIALATIVSHKVQPSFDWYSYFSLHFWKSSAFHPAQLFSYMFLHSMYEFNGASESISLTHVIFNMFTLFMFGPMLERVMGSKKFIIFYSFCGVGAAIVQEFAWTYDFWPMLQKLDVITGEIAERVADGSLQTSSYIVDHIEMQSMEQWKEYSDSILCRPTTVGASGAVYGILLAFGMIFPNMSLFIMFIPIPVKAKYVVIGYALLELYLEFRGLDAGVAHLAHLGGMLFGFILIYYWKRKGEINNGFGGLM
ncbi:MAG: rhomboid family intramembrane serine protease [Paludibacteraceae bacterium]|nr:rhomboid family intramembrane serine protease [Paludibacteraceae bacterium]